MEVEETRDGPRPRLEAARHKRHWTLEQAAEHIGCNDITLCRWEQGKTAPRGYYVQRLSKVYEAEPFELDLEEDHSFTLAEKVVMTDNISSSIEQDLTVRLMKIVISPSSSDYDAIQAQVNKVINDYNIIVEQDLDQVITRRNALRSLVLLPVATCELATLGRKKIPVKEVLTQCAAAIAACWHFGRGKELTLASDALSLYIPALKAISESNAPQRKDAASLLVQALILKAELARDIESLSASRGYLQQAINVSERAGSPMLTALSWRTLAATCYHLDLWGQALSSAQEAKNIMTAQPKGKQFPLDVQSFIYAGLSVYQAVSGRKDEALASVKAMNTTYQSQSEDAPHWMSHSYGNVVQCDGMVYYYLGDYKPALSSFETLCSVAPASITEALQYAFDRVRIEASRDDAPRDMEFAVDLWTQGITGTKELRSEQRFKDARASYDMLRAAWPTEQRVKGLRELLMHW